MGFRETTNCFSAVHLNHEKATTTAKAVRRSYLIMCQRTSGSGTLDVKPVSAGLAKQLGRMVEDAMPNYPGGLANAELVKGDPDFTAEFYKFCDARAETLAWQDRPVWKIVTVGTHASKDELKKAVTDEGHKFSDWALGLINTDGFTIETTLRQIGLFTATVAEIGFPKGGKVKDIYAKLDELGFGICPDETALQLRREYKDQPMDEWRRVVTEPKAGTDGLLAVLYVVRDSGGSWVDWRYAYPDSEWSADYRLVFCRK